MIITGIDMSFYSILLFVAKFTLAMLIVLLCVSIGVLILASLMPKGD
jgi:hypothetical protein